MADGALGETGTPPPGGFAGGLPVLGGSDAGDSESGDSGDPVLGGVGVETPTLGVEMFTLGVETLTPGSDTPTLGSDTSTLGSDTSTLGSDTSRLGSDTSTLGTVTATLGTVRLTPASDTAADDEVTGPACASARAAAVDSAAPKAISNTATSIPADLNQAAAIVGCLSPNCPMPVDSITRNSLESRCQTKVYDAGAPSKTRYPILNSCTTVGVTMISGSRGLGVSGSRGLAAKR